MKYPNKILQASPLPLAREARNCLITEGDFLGALTKRVEGVCERDFDGYLCEQHCCQPQPRREGEKEEGEVLGEIELRNHSKVRKNIACLSSFTASAVV